MLRDCPVRCRTCNSRAGLTHQTPTAPSLLALAIRSVPRPPPGGKGCLRRVSHGLQNTRPSAGSHTQLLKRCRGLTVSHVTSRIFCSTSPTPVPPRKGCLHCPRTHQPSLCHRARATRAGPLPLRWPLAYIELHSLGDPNASSHSTDPLDSPRGHPPHCCHRAPWNDPRPAPLPRPPCPTLGRCSVLWSQMPLREVSGSTALRAGTPWLPEAAGLAVTRWPRAGTTATKMEKTAQHVAGMKRLCRTKPCVSDPLPLLGCTLNAVTKQYFWIKNMSICVENLVLVFI